MNKWFIPAKTFLVGEYAALTDAGALLLTTTPYFELSLSKKEGIEGIDLQSPAGRWWQQNSCAGVGLSWYDPYLGQGGLGASSAQFIAVYLALCQLRDKTPEVAELLAEYSQFSWQGKGLKPSGYDVIAQTQAGCVYVNRQKKWLNSYAWPFPDLSFLLIHTGIKCATHQHLEQSVLPEHINQLANLVEQTKWAFENSDSQLFLACVNNYYEQLHELNLIAPHSMALVQQLKAQHPEILAIKGCGALGSDIILMITASEKMSALQKKLLLQKNRTEGMQDSSQHIATQWISVTEKYLNKQTVLKTRVY